MARTRTTKKLAQRIDLNYFKRPTPLKRAKFWLSLLLPLLALVWIAWSGFSGDHRVYSSGRMSRAHAVLEKQCAACHVQTARAFSAKAADSACLDCHDGPIHHAVSPIGGKHLACAECHTEHRGRIDISAPSDQTCAECHKDLRKSVLHPQYGWPIDNFQDSHFEFAALRPIGYIPARDFCTIKLNHSIHMKPIRSGPSGPIVQLQCGDCHRPDLAVAPWTYSDRKYMSMSHSYSEQEEGPIALAPDTPRKPMTGRELMAPVRFATACAGCHLLTFDKRFDEVVPHDKTKIVDAFLTKKYTEYILAHPSELREKRDPNRDLAGKQIPQEVRLLTPAQWVAEHTAEAEELLWRKTCLQCHELRFPSLSANFGKVLDAAGIKLSEAELKLPNVTPASVTRQWMPHAKFDHDAHHGFTCVSCHRKALTSTESSDILLPGIATCKTCHAPGPDHADSRCSECHIYHDWSKRKEVTPKFTLPALRTGGR